MKRKNIITYSVCATLLIGLLTLFTNPINAQQRQFITYLTNPELSEKQQHYADAWSKLDWVESFKFIDINVSMFKGNTINVNLPANELIAVQMEELIERNDNMVTWKGSFNNQFGNADFVIHNDMVTARISCLTYVYLIYPISDGKHIIMKCNGERMPQDESESGYKEMLEKGAENAMKANQNHIDPETGNEVEQVLAGNCKVRILVAYTDDADANLADPISFVQSCIDATNTAYTNSLVNFSVELAVAIREVYAESLNSTTDKTRFHDTADGYMDDVHDYRTYFDADMCILITENLQSGICGEAFVVANSTYTQPFCVVTRGCAVGNLSFPHELGHLYGCRHDTYVDATNTPYAYGHGYVYLAAQWRTIMAYNNYCTNNGSSCTRIQRFSNPGATYFGVATGVAGINDNESALEASRANISSLETPLTDKIFSNSYYFNSGEYSDVIALSSTTNSANFYYYSGSQGSWRAGTKCVMTPGFRAYSGSSFIAYLDACTALRTADETQLAELKSNVVKDNGIQIQPNPFNDKFDMVYELAEAGNVQIQLFNMMGSKVKDLFSQKLELAGPYQFTFDGSDLPAGIYMCVIHSETGMKSIRIAKAK